VQRPVLLKVKIIAALKLRKLSFQTFDAFISRTADEEFRK
jgi:hypothetical protein